MCKCTFMVCAFYHNLLNVLKEKHKTVDRDQARVGVSVRHQLSWGVLFPCFPGQGTFSLQDFLQEGRE